MLANIHKLVHSTHTADDSPVANGNMTCHLCVSAHDAVVAYKTIVREVTIGHDKAVFTNHCLIPILGAAINCYKFTDSGAIADINIGVLALEFEILWNG